MKSLLLQLAALAMIQELSAQTTTTTTVVPVAPAAAPPAEVIIRTERPALQAAPAPSDTVVLRSRLSVAPRVVRENVRPAPVTEVVPTETVKTTRTTTTVDEPGRPRRVYNAERNVVVVEEQGQARELPYVTLPVLFVKSTAELLDQESRAALEQMAGVILEISKTSPGSVFDIEGHTSTEGTEEFNLELSGARAQRIYDELTKRYGVSPTMLTAHGYGKHYPAYPNGTEDQLQLDRRVLVVRAK